MKLTPKEIKKNEALLEQTNAQLDDIARSTRILFRQQETLSRRKQALLFTLGKTG